MRLDILTELSNAQDIHAASVASTYSYDCGIRSNYDDTWNSHPGQQNVGNGNPVRIAFTIKTAVAASGAPTLTVAIQGGTDNSTFATTVAQVGPLSVATMTSMLDGKGDTPGSYQFDMFLPEGPIPRYLQAYYTIGGTGSFTSITISSDVVLDFQSNRTW